MEPEPTKGLPMVRELVFLGRNFRSFIFGGSTKNGGSSNGGGFEQGLLMFIGSHFVLVLLTISLFHPRDIGYIYIYMGLDRYMRVCISPNTYIHTSYHHYGAFVRHVRSINYFQEITPSGDLVMKFSGNVG